MKKRRTLIISLLLVAALALGIGYAGFTSELTINGEAVMNATSTSLVNISNVTEVSKHGDLTLTSENLGSKTVGVDITGFSTTQDYIVIEVTVENPHEFEVTLSAPSLSMLNNEIITGGKCFNVELLNAASIPTSIPKATYVDGQLVPQTITFQYKISVDTIDPNAHTVSYTITASASSR